VRVVEVDPPRANARQPAAVALGAGVAALVVAAAVVVGARSVAPVPPGASHLEVRSPGTVILAVRELGRLEAAEFHMERVVELTDVQQHLFGLVEAKDAILLVAVGEVVAGVDLAALADADVTLDPQRKKARLRVPQPEILVARIDSAKTHVWARTTDTLARRREDLEGRARAEAEEAMKRAAVEGGILDRARSGTERTLRALLAPLGVSEVEVVWR